MTSPLDSSSLSPSPTSAREVADAKTKVKARPVAIASLVAFVAWVAGIGSILGIILGFVDLRKVKEDSNLNVGSRPAIVGIIVGVVGLIPSVIMWKGVMANSASNSKLTSSSYIDGSNYASANFSDTVRESSVCTSSNATSEGDNTTLSMQGCHDGWAIASPH
jgi:hypothetical protein